MRITSALACLLFGGLLLTAGCMNFDFFRRGDSAAAKTPRIGSPAPELEGEDFAGKKVKLSEQRGKVVAVVFWASWCGPCRAMIPHERELVERYRGKPFVMLGVNNDENHDDARRIIAAEKMSWPILKTIGTRDPLVRLYGVKSWPAVFVIDTKGTLRYTGVRGPSLENAIQTLLAEAGS